MNRCLCEYGWLNWGFPITFLLQLVVCFLNWGVKIEEGSHDSDCLDFVIVICELIHEWYLWQIMRGEERKFCHKWERKHLEREKKIFIYNGEIVGEFDAILVEYKFAKIRKVGILDKIWLYPYWVCKCSYRFLQWARFEIFKRN